MVLVEQSAVGERHAHKASLATGHLSDERQARCLGRAHPGEIERARGRRAVAVDRHDEREGDGVLTWIMEAGHVGVGKVLNDSERLRGWRNAGERHRTEVLFQVADERIPNALTMQDTPGDDRPADRTVGQLTKEQSD